MIIKNILYQKMNLFPLILLLYDAWTLCDTTWLHDFTFESDGIPVSQERSAGEIWEYMLTKKEFEQHGYHPKISWPY